LNTKNGRRVRARAKVKGKGKGKGKGKRTGREDMGVLTTEGTEVARGARGAWCPVPIAIGR